MTLTNIFIYPVKSLAGIALQEAQVELRGLRHDRRWMVTDMEGRFVTQREIGHMARIGTDIREDGLWLFDRRRPEDTVQVPFFSDNKIVPQLEVRVWGDVCAGYATTQAADAWLSEHLGQALRLVYMPDTVQRHTDARYAPAGQFVSYADGFPFLLIGEASLDDLNRRLEQPVPMDRFRPNFVFEGGQPYEEDDWSDFWVGGVPFRGVKPCGRCVMTTINQDTTERLPEPLRTLATYRMRDKSIKFGQNVIWTGEEMAPVRVGDVVRVG